MGTFKKYSKILNMVDKFENASEAANIKETKEQLQKWLKALIQREQAIGQEEMQWKEVEAEAKRQYEEQLKHEEEEKQWLLHEKEEKQTE